MKKYKRSPQDSGFSLVELLVTIVVVSVLSTAGFAVFSKINTHTKAQKLHTEIATLNSAVGSYLGFGGNLDSAQSPEGVLSQLRSVANSDIANRIPGLSSSMVDRRIAGVQQTAEEATTTEPRVLWNTARQRFEIATSGAAGISAFYLNENDAEITPSEDSREFQFLYSQEGGWVWDYNRDQSTPAVQGPTIVQTYDPITIVNNTPGEGLNPGDEEPNNTPALAAPIFSLNGGDFSIREYPMGLIIVNPNPPGSSDVYYQVDHGLWSRLGSGTVIEVAPDSVITAQSVALSSAFLDSSGTNHSYIATPVQLNPPTVSTSASSFGVFNNRMVMVSLENTSGDDPSTMQYAINDGPWLDYTEIFIMDQVDFEEGAMVKSQAISEDQYYLTSDISSEWVSAQSVDVEDSDGAFHDPDGGPNMETNLTAENPYNNYFEWGTVTNQWGEIDPDLSKSWLDFEGIEINEITVGKRFKLGDIDYFDGVFNAGTHANKVKFAIGLGFDSEGTIYNTEFDYLFNIAHTTNGQSSFGNARLVMPNSTSSYEIDGITFDLLLEFGLPDEEYDVQPESTTESTLYGTLFEREEISEPRNRWDFAGIFAEFWDRLTH